MKKFLLLIFLIVGIAKAEDLKVYGFDQEVFKFKDFYFIKNLEIFELNGNTFGRDYKYKTEKPTTFVELAYQLKVSYYELKAANPDINPFKVPANVYIKVPLRKQLPENYQLNTVYVSTQDHRLYLPIEIEGKRYVITFPVGLGGDDFPTPKGEFVITEKKLNPDWVVPPSARRNNPNLPPVVPYGSPENGLGTRALRLNNSSYMIHGTSKRSEKGVGMNISYGCIVLRNQDIERIFELIPLNAKVVIY
ncbi:MAG TPA: L,D-transpeptidase [Sulfurihydrogenibium azorense]|uniref:L,D-transpeptidase n=1 Tax=Sulfurihydrogenibium azorense TaxID=309806 RepID=A0A831YDZ0_9AQUI|nr:L,D-transpeptidase [Sulfurihydrogenibium azorense]